MSSIRDTAKSLMAALYPLTGTRATGPVTVKATGDDVTLLRSEFCYPVIDGHQAPNQVFKVGRGPGEDGCWTVTAAGTSVTFLSNIGGERFNLKAGTRLVFDPPIDGIDAASVEVETDFTGGQNSVAWDAVKDVVLYEQVQGSDLANAMKQSGLRNLPGIMITWTRSNPSDGSTTSQSDRATRVGGRQILYSENYLISIIVDRYSSADSRSELGLHLVDEVTAQLADLQSVDGVPISWPSGVQIQDRFQYRGPDNIYQKIFMYNVAVNAMQTIEKRDERTWADLALVNVDVIKQQRPPLPNQGDMTLIDDMQMEID